MALLLRTSMEKRNMRKFTMILMHLATTAMIAGVPAAAMFYITGAATLGGMALGPSRRSVGTGSALRQRRSGIGSGGSGAAAAAAARQRRRRAAQS